MRDRRHGKRGVSVVSAPYSGEAMNDTVSIVILVKNGARYLENLVPALAHQIYAKEKELVVVDSGSTDGSVELLKRLCEHHRLELNLSTVEPHEFGYGKTRNYAIQRARGDIIAVLSQDTLPLSENWLSNLLEPFADRTIAGVFGRQIPWPGTNLCEVLFYELTYPTESRCMDLTCQASFSNLHLFFSNVNGAIRKSLALTYPYREDLIMSEDQDWACNVLDQGYSIIYEPSAAVYHSHDLALTQLFKRYYQYGYSHRQQDLHGDVFHGGFWTAITVLRKVLLSKLWYLPYALIFIFCQSAGFLCGRYDLLPSVLSDDLLELKEAVVVERRSVAEYPITSLAQFRSHDGAQADATDPFSIRD